MGKARMTALDLRAVARSLDEQCRQLRVANVYDISSKVYVLKLSENNESEKRHLILQSGIRAHLSQWKRNKQAIPSVFTMKLRKFMRTKRITRVQQLGSDRVLDIQCGSEEHAVHLIVELYSRGNVVLTDHEYMIISAWRQFKGDDQLSVTNRSKYPVEHYTDNDFLENWRVNEHLPGRPLEFRSSALAPWGGFMTRVRNGITELLASPATKKTKKPLLAVEIVANLAANCHRQMILDESDPLLLATSLADAASLEDSILQPSLEKTFLRLLQIWREVSSPPFKGYTYRQGGCLTNLSPYPLALTSGVEVNEFDSIHEAADSYFTSAEVDKAEKIEGERLNELENKFERIRRDQAERVGALQEKALAAEQHANAVEYHVAFINKVIDMMTRLVKSGSDWNVLSEQIKAQSRANHPVASYIQETDFARSRVRILIPASNWGEDEDFDTQLGKMTDNHNSQAIQLKFEDSESGSDDDSQNPENAGDLAANSFIEVWIEYNQSAYSNVMRLHNEKKQALLKYEKTKQAADQILKEAEQLKAKEAAKKAASVGAQKTISRVRKVFWFEKFFWCLSSDGYLILAGHDAMQNEILYKKYLGKKDLYVHADVHGASSCIIRNPTPDVPVPETTIQEAGIVAVCRSNAWKTKILAVAYWVYAHQVSKTPPPGEYVSTGGFIIRGERHVITVHKLELGICLLFCLGDQKSIDRHKKLRHEETGPILRPQPKTSGAASPVSGVRDSNSVEARSPTLKVQGEGLEESSNIGSRRDSLKSQSSRVQFGVAEVAPTPVIEASVSFDPEQTEVIPIHSNRSVHSYRSELSSSDAEEMSNDAEICLDKHHAGGICEEDEHIRGTRWRPDSADELPPPEEYADRAAPGPLLRKETPETAALTDLLAEIADNPASPIAVKHRCLSNVDARRMSRDRIDKIGPAPRGYLPNEAPEARTLLRKNSSQSVLISHSKAETICIPSPIGEEYPSPSPTGQAPAEQAQTTSVKKNNNEGKPCAGGKKPAVGGPAPTVPKQKQAQINRVKNAKMKKMKEKYGDQSDDEREYAMMLIGSKKLKAEAPDNTVSEINEAENLHSTGKKEPVFIKDREFKDEEEEEIERDWQGRMTAFDELTGNPSSEDLTLFAIPMVGPVSSTARCKFKGRLLPGGLKKGQAVSIIHRAFIELADKESIIRQLIKNISVDEISAVLPANPAVQMEGASKIRKADKKDKKATKKLNKL